MAEASNDFVMPYHVQRGPPPPYARFTDDEIYRATYKNHWFGEKKKMFFYNNTEKFYTVVLVNTFEEDVSEYEPVIKLKLKTIENSKILTPVVALTLGPCEYMCVHTVNIRVLRRQTLIIIIYCFFLFFRLMDRSERCGR
jgi:hypothetical protein